MVDHASDLYDEARRKEDKRQVARTLNIQIISPDPAQPRRVLPKDVRARWTGTPEDLPHIFELWQQLAEAERGKPIHLYARVLAAEVLPMPEEGVVGPLEASLLALADLAADIRRNGLLNSITVARQGERFQIETGERRWLAHHLLYAVTQEEGWQFISARIVDKPDVWRQAGENSARTNLNAVSKARQFALLLMALYGESGVTFAPFSERVHFGGCDRSFYAQVADAEQYRIPKGKGEQLLGAMGLRGRASFSRYRALLNLPDEIWQMGDDLNWSDDRLYLLATMEPGQALQRARQMKRRDDLRRAQRSVLIQNNYQNNTNEIEPESDAVTYPLETGDFKKRTLRVARMLDRVERLDSGRRRDGLDEIRAIRRWLDEAERLLREESSI